jgi:nucleotide-binding universal stress UspA family protein
VFQQHNLEFLIMTYKTLMVHLQLGQSNANLLQVTSNIAEQYQCGVIGIVAAQPLEVIYADGCYIASDVIQQCRDQLEADINAAEVQFRHGLRHGPGPLAWRSSVTLDPLSGFVAHEARSADLILTGIARKAARGEPETLRIGDLVMEAGRPLLIIPERMEQAHFNRVVIAWKDTSEARRAITDALPLLHAATHVTVVEIVPEDEMTEATMRCDSVVAWLQRHGIHASSKASASVDEAATLREVAEGADLIVAGAYGHNRLREWAFGGVTHDLLLHGDYCTLVSH